MVKSRIDEESWGRRTNLEKRGALCLKVGFEMIAVEAMDEEKL